MSETVNRFIDKYGKWAKLSANDTGVPALFTLAQCALETGWGKSVKGNNMFGIKDTDGLNGNEIEFLTTEYNKQTGWHKVKAFFRKYKTPKESFDDHAKFLIKNERYKAAFNYEHDPVMFAKEVAKAGYATDPQYAQKIITIMKMIKPYFN